MENKFGKRLTLVMEIRNIKQKQLASITGVTVATVSRYVNDKRTPDIEFIKKVVNALNVSADFLLGFTEDMTVHREEGPMGKYKIIREGYPEEIEIVDSELTAILDTFFSTMLSKGKS